MLDRVDIYVIVLCVFLLPALLLALVYDVASSLCRHIRIVREIFYSLSR